MICSCIAPFRYVARYPTWHNARHSWDSLAAVALFDHRLRHTVAAFRKSGVHDEIHNSAFPTPVPERKLTSRSFRTAMSVPQYLKIWTVCSRGIRCSGVGPHRWFRGLTKGSHLSRRRSPQPEIARLLEPDWRSLLQQPNSTMRGPVAGFNPADRFGGHWRHRSCQPIPDFH